MKRYNLLIQDKDEREWNKFVQFKEESNIDEAILNLIRKRINVKEQNKFKSFLLELKGKIRNIGKTNIITLTDLDAMFVKHGINLRELKE